MACQVILQSWTLSGLVGAFLDLAIAYLLLCCSAVAFFITNILNIFGLSLPCPCNGLFGYPYHGPCFQRLLLDCPTQTVSSVQLSVKSKFPFDAILARNDHCQLNLNLIKSDHGPLELDNEEASYSSFSDPRRSQHSLSGSDSIAKIDLKGKAPSSQRQRQRTSLRRRRRTTIDYDRLTSPSSYDHMDVRDIARSPSEPSKIGSELNAHNFTPINFHDDPDASVVPGGSVPDFEANDATYKNKVLYDNATSCENLTSYVGRWHGFDGQDENGFRILEQALEEEQAARAALYSELEQERIAAATAADEAMSMISRLQEEKASIEIEARQYQRILEEKSAYDSEEMNILKEIIVRRELEKHFLEKEVEAYRKVLQENGGLESQVEDTQGQNETFSLESSVDPMLMLQQLSESIDKRGDVQKKSSYHNYASASVEKQTVTVSLGEESSILKLDCDTKIVKGLESPEYSNIIKDHSHNGIEISQEIQEKGMVSLDEIPYPQSSKLNNSPDHHILEDKAALVVEADVGKEMQMQVSELQVHDIHIIDSECDVSSQSTSKRNDPLLMHSNPSNVARDCELPFEASNIQRLEDSANSLRVEPDINRSCSDVVGRFPSVSSSPGRSSIPELRRHSLSAVDHERLRIDNEIGWLRERLRAVQEEKDKLKTSFEHRERGKTELQLLEDISTQLREIQHQTEPEKAARQASLPPLSSKGTSRKRRSRSASVGGGHSASS